VSLDFRRATINFKIYFFFHTRKRFFWGILGRFLKFFAASRQLPVLENFFWRKIRNSEEVSTTKIQFRNGNEEIQYPKSPTQAKNFTKTETSRKQF
jgi:hypothetical protein